MLSLNYVQTQNITQIQAQTDENVAALYQSQIAECQRGNDVLRATLTQLDLNIKDSNFIVHCRKTVIKPKSLQDLINDAK